MQRSCIVDVPSMEGLGLGSDSLQFVQNIGAMLFVGLTIGELYRNEAVPLVEPARAGIGLKRVQANG